MSIEKGFYPDVVKFICCIICQNCNSIEYQRMRLYGTDYKKYLK